jgi:hypothetical protein
MAAQMIDLRAMELVEEPLALQARGNRQASKLRIVPLQQVKTQPVESMHMLAWL